MNYRTRSISAYSLIAFILCLSFFGSAGYAENAFTDHLDTKRALFLSAYSPGFESFFYQIDGIKSVFDGEPVLFDVEFMDSKRFYTPQNLSNFYTLLKYKLSRIPPYDLIVAADDNALDFVVEHEELFPSQPIVFLGINDLDKAKNISQNPRITGIYESTSIKSTIELAHVLIPEAKRVIALVDDTVTGRAVSELYRAVDAQSLGLELSALNVSEMTFLTFQKQLRSLNKGDIVLYISALKDQTGETIKYSESFLMIQSALNQPVFCLYDFAIEDGLVGGDVISFYDQGREAGELALRILKGASPESIPVTKNDTIKLLDYRRLQDFNLNAELLPSDVILENRPESVLKRFLPYIFLALGIIVLEGLLIAYLRSSIRRRKLTEAELLERKQDLVKSNDSLAVANEELVASNEELEDSNQKLTVAIRRIEEQNREIYDLIYLDGLTHLKNRMAISETIEKTLAYADEDHHYAILFLDVDNFKDINDSFGHDFGDQVIVETALRLSSLECASVQIGRFGGDEFLIIYGASTMDGLSEFLMRIEGLFHAPVTTEERSLFLTISIGVALYPLHGRLHKELIKKADMALYDAKGSGKNRAVIYNQKMIEQLENKVIFQSHVRNAFIHKEFYLNYQPYFDVEKQRFTGAEALVRWNSPDLGSVSPLRLIQSAEEMGLIVEIGKWILIEACTFAKKLNEHAPVPITLSINISPVQLMHSGFTEDLKEILDATGVEPSSICLEMTETTLFEFTDGNAHVVDQIKRMGIGIALDDFGTGYSSLSYFKNIPASIIKIDKEFIEALGEDSFTRYTVESIINLAHQKSLQVVAEGVEHKKQLDILAHLGCDIIQGYYYSKPLMPEAAWALFLQQK